MALGGGGARGLAHIGVLDALLEAGIAVSGIAGTSMGAIVGGVFAAVGHQSKDPRRLARLLAVAPHSPVPVGPGRHRFRDWFDTAAYLRDDLFGQGRDDGMRLEREIEAWVGPRRIEELPLPFAAVATDVRSGEPVVLSRGALAPALHASAALPGVYLPVRLDGRSLIDGGVVETDPVSAARGMAGDVVLAVCVSPALDRKVPTTGLGLLARTEAIRAARMEALALAAADVAIRVRLPRSLGMFDFDQASRIIALGKASMQRQLPAVREALARRRG